MANGVLNIRGVTYDLRQAFLDVARPVGSVYEQYPGQTDPNTLFNGNGLTSTWAVQDYQGAFFRAENTLGESGPALAFNAGKQTGQNKSHSHGMSSHTHGLSDHTHVISDHYHGIGAHTHGLSDHTHSNSGITDGISANHAHRIPGWVVPILIRRNNFSDAGVDYAYGVVHSNSWGFDNYGRPNPPESQASGYVDNSSYSTDNQNANHFHGFYQQTGGPSTSETTGTSSANTTGTSAANTGGPSTANTGGPSTANTASDGGTEVRPDNYTYRIWKRTA